MASNLKPILHTISAFDAEFGSSGKENIAAPIFKFSWEDGVVVHKNRVTIRDYKTNKIVYDYTLESRALKHQLVTKDSTYALKNGEKYIANVYVYTSDNVASLPSNDVIFYCYDTPTFKFTNFETGEFLGANNAIAIAKTSSINFTVKYSQINGEPLSNYQFILKNYNGNILHTSDTKYSSLADDILRYTVGGIEETGNDELTNNYTYTISCIGETQHGLIIHAEQKFIVRLENSGVGALVKVENVGDGNVLIYSNYKMVNVDCSTENPIYVLDNDQNPYAIDLRNNDYVEFTDGFFIQYPYEIIFKGTFNVGKLLSIRDINGNYGYVYLKKINYTTTPYYYFSFEVNDMYEIRTDYFTNIEESVSSEIDLIYKNGLYDIKRRNI